MAANTVQELYAFSQWRFALIREDEYLDNDTVTAIASFAEKGE